MTRTFIAIDLPDPTRKEIEIRASQLQDRLKGKPIRWTKISSIHLTLKFLGDSSAEQIADAKEILSRIGSRTPTFKFDINRIGCFPNPRRARVLWMGIEETSGLLRGLHAELEQRLIEIGYPQEKRAFSPHLTLGRIKTKKMGLDLSRVLPSLPFKKMIAIEAKQISLYRSDLRPEGALYTCLHSAQFQGGENG